MKSWKYKEIEIETDRVGRKWQKWVNGKKNRALRVWGVKWKYERGNPKRRGF